jgi:hypothetical protein
MKLFQLHPVRRFTVSTNTRNFSINYYGQIAPSPGGALALWPLQLKDQAKILQQAVSIHTSWTHLVLARKAPTTLPPPPSQPVLQPALSTTQLPASLPSSRCFAFAPSSALDPIL